MAERNTLSRGVMSILESRGLSQRQMAGIVGVHPSELSRIKAGSREWTTAQLVAIAEYLNMPLGVLLLVAMRTIENRQSLNRQVAKLVDRLIREAESLLDEAAKPAAA